MPDFRPLCRRDCLRTIAGAAFGVTTSSFLGVRQTNAADSNPPRSPVVDTHMHVWSDDPEQFPFSHPFNPDFNHPPTSAPVEMLLEDMDQNGVTHSILVQCIYHGWDNRYVAECGKAHPDRFRVQGLIDPEQADVAETLEHWMSEYGLSGMRLNPIYYQGHDEWLDSPAHLALWKKAQELGAVFNMFIASEQLPRLAGMAQQFPDVPVLIDHVAYVKANGTNTELDKLLALASLPNVSVKVSELQSIAPSRKYPYTDAHNLVKRVYDAFGPDRLLWGTGFPGAARAHYKCPTLKQELDLIRTELPYLTAEDKPKILGLNAARIWKLDV